MRELRAIAAAGLAAIVVLLCFSGWQVYAQSTQGPTIEFVSPSDGVEVRPSSEVTIVLDVSDPQGVRSVELYWRKLNQYWPCENVPERRCTRQGNRYTWRIEIGSATVEREFHIRAVDNAGNRTTSPDRSLRVTSQPTGVTLALVSPTRGQIITPGETLTFSAQASTESGELTGVQVRMLVDPIAYELNRDPNNARLWRLPARVANDAAQGEQAFILEAEMRTGVVARAGPYHFHIRSQGGPGPEEGNFPVHRWRGLSAPDDERADDALVAFNNLAATDRDGSGTLDVQCPITPQVRRQGPVTAFSFGDGSLDTQSEVTQVVSRERGAYVVNEINYCGGPPDPGNFIIGCATVGSHGAIAVVNRSTAQRDGRLWLHEYGHTKGLGHRGHSSNIMQSGSDITAAQCPLFQVFEGERLLGGETLPERGATPEPIATFVRREFFEGVPWAEADQYGPADVPFLLGQLRSPSNGVSLPTVVGVLGVIGDTRAVQPLIQFITRHQGAIGYELYSAKKAALLSLGLIAAQAEAPEALAYLYRGLDPAHWQSVLRWRLPYAAPAETRDWQMVKAATWGVAVSGRPEAGVALQRLDARLRSRAFAGRTPPNDLDELLQTARDAHRAVAAQGVERFYLNDK
jgi:hypothetical protein